MGGEKKKGKEQHWKRRNWQDCVRQDYQLNRHVIVADVTWITKRHASPCDGIISLGQTEGQ